MSLHRLRLGPCSSFCYADGPSSQPTLTSAVRGSRFQQAPMPAKIRRIVCLKNTYKACVHTQSLSQERFDGALQLLLDEESNKLSSLQLSTGQIVEECKTKDIIADEDEAILRQELGSSLYRETEGAADLAKVSSELSNKEIQRRWKIGLANKGRVPWNKGRKHSEETRERIRKRTTEALSNPKVRKKMSECLHSHSDQSKRRISLAQRKIWEVRLKLRRSQENCYKIWAESIAEAARIGGQDQRELDWDSYEKMKADITSQHLQWKADKARAKEIAKLRAKRAAKIRAENMARLAQQRKEREQKTKTEKPVILSQKISKSDKKKTTLSKGLKLKERLTKFHHRKRQLESLTSFQRDKAVETKPVIEKWDIELIKTEKMQRKVSLADQIRAVKSKKAAEFSAREVSATSFFHSSVGEQSTDY